MEKNAINTLSPVAIQIKASRTLRVEVPGGERTNGKTSLKVRVEILICITVLIFELTSTVPSWATNHNAI